MRILSMDTATRSCSVAIASEDALLAELTVVSTQTHSKHLMNMIDQALQMARMEIDQIDGISITKGPGSFTGLRIGISVAKSLATALGKPMVGISALETLAHQAGDRLPLICPMIDARREEVYYSRYRFKSGNLTNETPECAQTVETAIANHQDPCLFIGNGALLYRDTIKNILGAGASFAPRFDHTIRASTVASLGIDRFLKQGIDDVETFGPYYIRKSDAEMNLGV